ncbi:unnamed protein product [Porites evermanni]|uniref:Uncharacterized protein n=1 Tax=Porites evermanni TaxID=104178 RepID=A0ABN8MKV7_9CNID|nr:unnamed protein product [Porites evermanni]
MAYDRSEWELSEFGNLIETENEKYGEIVQIAERRRTAEKYIKIRKIRQEMTWGVRVTKTLYICYCGRYVAYKESILAELVPPFQFYLRDKEYYTTYKGTPFRLPAAYKFKYYENAVECWHHNAILSDEKQLKILVRYNFEKFVRALETIGEPTAAKIQYDYDTCVSSISPFSESENEESDADDEDDRSEGKEQDHSINKIFPFSFSGDEENESDDEDDRGEGEEQDHSINKIFPFSFSGDEENESDDEDDRGEGEEPDHSINKIFPFSFSGDEESECGSKSDCSDESTSKAELDHEDETDEEEEHDQSDDELPRLITSISESDDDERESYNESDDEDEDSEEGKQGHSIDEISSLSESDYEESESDSKSDCSDESTSKAELDQENELDEEEEHDQSDDDLPMITPYSESVNRESESYYGSDEQSEEEEQDHHSDEITEDEEEMYFAKKEDNDKKFDSEDVLNLQLLHCREEVSQKCDPEESDLGILFGAEEHNHNLDLEKVGSLSSLVEKVEQDDVLDSEDVSNKDQFNEVEAQGPFNQEQQQQQQQHCSEHMVEHRPSKNKKKRKNILMGWLCSKIINVFIKSKVLL